MTPKVELGRDFGTFTRSEVIVLTNTQTNKHTPLKISNAVFYAIVLCDLFSKFEDDRAKTVVAIVNKR